MKFISVKSVVEAYKGFQDCMTNKSWGYLALLKGCKSSICPSVPYEVNLDEVACSHTLLEKASISSLFASSTPTAFPLTNRK